MKNIIFFSIIVFVAFVGCKTKANLQAPQEENTILQDTTTERILDNTALMYPADVLYVIGREYEEIADSTSAKANSAQGQKVISQNITLPQYMEIRLLELYPQKAFRGMMADFDLNQLSGLIQNDNRLSVPDKAEVIFTSPSSTAQAEPFYQFVSLEDEAKFLNMSPRELGRYWALNKLASDEKFAAVADFEEIRDSIPSDIPEIDRTFMMEENVFLSSLMFVTGGGYLAYRVLQSKERAIYKAQYYYGADISCGKRGDAFKHLYISMMLRRYVTENAAMLIMDTFWENWLVNSPCDRQMDLHNNVVGRRVQYDKFRGSFLRDRYDWEKWGVTIRNFVENKSNSVEAKWNKGTPEYIIVKEVKITDKSKYIYWNPTSECEAAPLPPTP